MSHIYTPSFGDEDFDFSDTIFSTPEHNSRRMRSMDHSASMASEYEHHHQSAVLNNANDDDIKGVHSMTAETDASSAAAGSTANKQMPTTLTEPTKPFSPYGFFFRDSVSAIKQQNPTCTFQEISAIVTTMWDALDDVQKQHYNSKHELAKQEYFKALRVYKQQLQQIQHNDYNVTEMEVLQQQQQLNDQQQSQYNPNILNNFHQQQNSLMHEPQPQTLSTTAAVPQQQQALVTSPDSTTHEYTNSATTSTLPPAGNTGSVEAAPTPTPPPQQQIQLLTEAAATQKCTRINCNKPAIINPDWEDEYCSNECVVIHCRNVFNEWVHSCKMNANANGNVNASTS